MSTEPHGDATGDATGDASSPRSPQPPPRGPGHLFVVHGDLTRFACDAWLLPTDYARHITRSWWTPQLTPHLARMECWPSSSPPGQQQPMPGRCLTVDLDGASGPIPVLTRMGNRRGTPIEWYLDGVTAYVEQAIKLPRTLPRRARRLLAVPLVGTGWGGKRRQAGAMVDALVPHLQHLARLYGVDIALVTRTSADFAGAQAARRPTGDIWPSLSAALQRRARELALDAAAGHLVVFLGAGVSAGAGLPLWSALLTQLAARAALTPEHPDWAHFERLDALDRAAWLDARLRDEGGLGAAIVAELGEHQTYSLAHGLIAGLPIDEAITTNYDQLFESACEAAGRRCAVLPYAPGIEHDRWLLKMHGCLEHPEDIVLTRENYLRYAQRNAALSGIVQAMLITRSMLFVGFSLGDDNFLRIVDAVRRAIGPRASAADRPRRATMHLGTALMLDDNPLMRTVWGDTLDWLDLARPGEGIAQAARRVEIFLDCLAHHAAAPAHLLDMRFAPVRTPADEALARLLEPLRTAQGPAKEAAAWPLVEDLLRRLGKGKQRR